MAGCVEKFSMKFRGEVPRGAEVAAGEMGEVSRAHLAQSAGCATPANAGRAFRDGQSVRTLSETEQLAKIRRRCDKTVISTAM